MRGLTVLNTDPPKLIRTLGASAIVATWSKLHLHQQKKYVSLDRSIHPPKLKCKRTCNITIAVTRIRGCCRQTSQANVIIQNCFSVKFQQGNVIIFGLRVVVRVPHNSQNATKLFCVFDFTPARKSKNNKNNHLLRLL